MLPKTRISFLCHPYHRGGVTRWMADAAIAFAASGHEVFFMTVTPVKEFISARGRETMLQLLSKAYGNVNIITENVGYEFEFGTDEYRAYVYKRLINKLPAGTPIILSDSSPTWEAATTFYGSYPVVGVLHSDEAHYYKLAVKYSKNADVLACVSKRVSRTVKDLLTDLSQDKVVTIPCGIELSPLSRLNGNTRDTLRLVYVGRISNYQKRTGDLVKIAAELVKNKTVFHLDIIGDGGKDRADLEQSFNEAGLAGLVTFKGWLTQQEVAQHLSQSDILVLTSDFEGTPIAMMEALAAGCGMAGTKVSGIEDYEDSPMAARCYGVYDVGDIAGAVRVIKQLAAVPVEERASAARTLAETEFTMQLCLQRYMDAIARVPVRSATVIKAGMPFLNLLYSKAISFARYSKLKLLR